MKKQLLISCAIIATSFVSSTTMARSGGDAFEEGKMNISIGYGFPNFTKMAFKTWETSGGYETFGMGPIHGKFEYALSDKIGLGLSVNYVQYKVQWNVSSWGSSSSTLYKEGFKGTSLSANARMNIHFATSDKLDPYWGIGVGYRSSNFSYFNDDPSSFGDNLTIPTLIPVGFETTIGLRYYFTDNIGAFVEMGASKSLVQSGLNIKF